MQFDEDYSIRLREKTVTVDKYSSVEGVRDAGKSIHQ